MLLKPVPVKVGYPFCSEEVNTKPLKTWKYGSFGVSRFECVCGKKFNLYTSPKKEFTIPKMK